MFSGSGTGPVDDDQEAQEQMEKAAKAMGMSVEEYQLGVKARVKLNNDLDSLRVTGGSEGIKVERCGNNPPKFLEITITEEGKARGKETLQKEIVAGMKQAGEDAKKGRTEAQKNMVRFHCYFC
jgi:DNA-binding protein YbaB